MDQLAMPYRIALVALLAVAALWFVALRPKADDSSSSAPGVNGLVRDVGKAKGAVATANGAAAKEAGTASAAKPAAAAKPAPTAAAKPSTPAATPSTPSTPASTDKLAPGDPSGPILRALDKGKVAVVVFSEPQGIDDAHVRAVVRGVDRHHGKVVVASASLRRVGAYQAITRGVQIGQGPTVVVIGPKRTARTIVGFTDRAEVDQLVSDAVRAAA